MLNNKLYISPKYELNDYKDLFEKLSPTSDDTSWQTAIKIFEDRIQGRFFDITDVMLEKCEVDPSLSKAFSIMALNCLLVETFQQFYKGIADTKGKSAKTFKEFLVNSPYFNGNRGNFGGPFNRKWAGHFYSNVRCGILHQAQTKKNTALTFNTNNLIDNHSKEGWVLYDVKLFNQALKMEYDNYINKLLGGDEKIRGNFCEKWRHILKDAE
ncbi:MULTISPECIES: hypothetical protein [Bacillus cereus group]|uniref:Uncharacterized protein n=1 Tax=Bacillus cereus VD118 TaxID=1053231 RepID=R8Q8H9_BACCE|nr:MULTISPECIES: hypothetical protein [Bacillus cereus group]EOP67406.1 hypothetical protein IIQ_05359 [Bacillus cereus VD118]MBJ8095374.1 hypothetical protein [Bacillus cereus]MCQ6359506.1 hypothetical protein [Bacillus cereus]CAH2464429.1 hypothetical protein ACOSJ1_EBGNOMHC_04963 [Bacillus mycoides KBAB4]